MILNDENANNKELEELYVRIGKNVKRYREDAKLSQLELSQKLNYKSVSSVSNPEIYYKKKHFFSLKQLFNISKILNIPLSSFFDN